MFLDRRNKGERIGELKLLIGIFFGPGLGLRLNFMAFSRYILALDYEYNRHKNSVLADNYRTERTQKKRNNLIY
jgi:hypothetical protein